MELQQSMMLLKKMSADLASPKNVNLKSLATVVSQLNNLATKELENYTSYPSYTSFGSDAEYEPYRVCHKYDIIVAMSEFYKWASHRLYVHPSRADEHKYVGLAFTMNVIRVTMAHSSKTGMKTIIENMMDMWTRITHNYVNDDLMRDIDLDLIQNAIRRMTVMRANTMVDEFWITIMNGPKHLPTLLNGF
jgi:hypothetical protein